MTSFITTYQPLIIRRAGRNVARKFGLPPFIDGSCRREPDLEAQFPSITALCRGANFAPRLHVGDTIAYLTVKASYPGHSEAHRRLTAVLHVEKRFESHQDAAEWYRAAGMKVPSNCCVPGNKPIPFKQTVQYKDPCAWDSEYQQKARKWPVFIVSRARYLNVSQPPIVTDDMLVEVFGEVPVTRTPPRIDDEAIDKLCELCSVELAA